MARDNKLDVVSPPAEGDVGPGPPPETPEKGTVHLPTVVLLDAPGRRYSANI